MMHERVTKGNREKTKREKKIEQGKRRGKPGKIRGDYLGIFLTIYGYIYPRSY